MKEDNILNEIEEWLDKVTRSFGTIPLSDIPTWRDFDEIYMGRVPRSNSPYHKRVLDKPYWHKYDIPFEMAYSDYKNIHHMIDNEIELDIDYGVAIECFERYRNVVIGFTNDKKLDNIENEIQEWLEETARSYGTIPPSKEVNWHDIEQVNHGYVPRDGDRKLDNKPHWDKYDISFESAFVDSVDITHMSTETLEGDFDTLIHLVKRYRNIVLSDEIASEYKKEEKKLPQVKNKNISSEDQYRVFCMFSQLSKEETDGYDCDEMWNYCHDLYSTFCDSEFNDDDMSEIDAMNNFLENIEERIAWCEINNYTIEMAEKNQKLYRVYSSITTKYFVDIDAINEDDAMDKARDLLEDCDFIEQELLTSKIDSSPSGEKMIIEQAELLEDKEVVSA